MTQDQFHNYFSRAQQLSTCIQDDPDALGNLLQLIDAERNTTCENLPYEEFLKGEHAFFSGKYKHALQHYLRAKSIPYFTLFCYRASAYVSESTGDHVKALNFAKQAITIFPDDYMTLTLLEKLLIHDQQIEEADKIRHRIQTLKTEQTHDCANEINVDYLVSKEKTFTTFQSAIECADALSMQSPKELCAFALKSPRTVETATKLQEMQVIFPKFSFRQSTPLPVTMPLPFTTLGSKDPLSTATLTQRLYSNEFSQNQTVFDSMIQDPIPEAAPNMTSIKELKKLADSSRETSIAVTTSSTPALDKEEHAETILDQSIKAFQKQQTERIAHYLEQFKKPLLNTHCLYFLHGWSNSTPNQQFPLTEHFRKSSGGYYLRWNGKGIVINPGMHFLENFHRQGLHIKDIDYVIVTGDHPNTYADIREIYALNYQLNQVSRELQLIHYYLNPKAYQTLSSTLKPHFKQERHTIHCLELFQDSPDVEQIELCEGIALSYFPLGKGGSVRDVLAKEGISTTPSACLGLRFDLCALEHTDSSKTPLSLGYISGAPWSPLLGQHLELCDIMITGFGHTNPTDYTKLRYNEDSLGYFGTYSLLEEISPKLLFCSEFDGKEGDIRIEVVKMMRQQYATAYPNARHTPTILPVDTQLYLDLLSMQIQCSASQTPIDPTQAHIVKCRDRFGHLQYLSPHCCL